MQELIVVGGWIGPTIAIVLCIIAVLFVLGWSLGAERDREDEIHDWLSGDDGDGPAR